VNIGYGVTRSPTTNDTVFTGDFDPVTTSSANLAAGGVVGGVQIGYNWQLAPIWLFGIEADIQGSDQRATLSSSTPDLANGPNFPYSNSVESRLKYFGTVRGRLGWLPSQSTLIYVTGGLAYGQTETTLVNDFAAFSGNPGVNIVSFRKTGTGFTVGGGIETRLWNSNWTAKAEYLYFELGNLGGSFTDVDAGVTHLGNVDFRDHVFRAGLNYKFDWGNGPVVARY
jgi:outer membrane immunogenic protein